MCGVYVCVWLCVWLFAYVCSCVCVPFPSLSLSLALVLCLSLHVRLAVGRPLAMALDEALGGLAVVPVVLKAPEHHHQLLQRQPPAATDVVLAERRTQRSQLFARQGVAGAPVVQVAGQQRRGAAVPVRLGVTRTSTSTSGIGDDAAVSQSRRESKPNEPNKHPLANLLSCKKQTTLHTQQLNNSANAFGSSLRRRREERHGRTSSARPAPSAWAPPRHRHRYRRCRRHRRWRQQPRQAS